MKSLTLYANQSFEEIFKELVENESISQSRVDFLLSQIEDSTFEDFLINGEICKNFMFHKPSKVAHIRDQIERDGGKYVKGCCLAELMTEDEIEIYTKHQRSFYSRSQDKKRFEKAEKISWKDWGEPVFNDDTYLSDIYDIGEYLAEEAIQAIEDKDFDKFIDHVPDFVWASREQKIFSEMDIYELFSRDLEEYSEWGPPIHGEAEFTEALNKFYEANKKNAAYWEDNSKAIILSNEFWKEIYERGY